MQQIQIAYRNSPDFISKLLQLKNYLEDNSLIENKVVFYITWSGNVKGKLPTCIDKIEEIFPDALYYGNEASGNIESGEFSLGINITCFIFESRRSKIDLIWIEKGTKVPSLNGLWNICIGKKDLKAIELIPTYSYSENFHLDQEIPPIDENVIIFGGIAASYDGKLESAEILAKNHPKTNDAMLAVIYSGSDLSFSFDFVLGFQGLGKTMEITRSEGKTVKEINHEVPLSILESYIGNDAGLPESYVFPLILQEDNQDYLRIPSVINEDGTMEMFVNIPEGTKVRISYGDRNNILDQIYQKALNIANFMPETIKAFSCASRRSFWGNDYVGKETTILNQIAPLTGFYSKGIFIRNGKKIRICNETLSTVSIREFNGKDIKPVAVSSQEVDRSMASRLAFFTRKVTQEQLETLKIAEEASQAKTRFLFNMSHDIRTPMNAIIGFANIATKEIENDPPKALEAIKKVQNSSEILLSIINDILDMSRIESGKAKVLYDEANICSILEKIEPIMTNLATQKDILVTYNTINLRNEYVSIDVAFVQRVLINIITNAIKYTNSGGRVDISLEEIGEDNEEVHIYKYVVADTGIGMSEEFQKHMFEEFSREENSTISGIQGTGLGLPLALKLTQLMGGNISCVSKQGFGSTFTISFPFKIIKKHEDNDLSVDQNEKIVEFKDKKVLIVEDNVLNREIASDIIQEQEMIAETAENGKIAVEMLKEKGPHYYDVILMDIQMPIMNGYEATKAIREMYPDENIIIIAVSANAFEEDKNASLAAGMNDHVAKPINIHELKQVMLKHMK